MTDPIKAELSETWRPHVLDESNIKNVQSWLKAQETKQIKRFRTTFIDLLETKYSARLALVDEELERRAKPPPDRVKQIIAALRSTWIVAVFIVVGIGIGGLAAFKESWCKLAPWTPMLCKIQNGEPDLNTWWEEN